EKTGGEIDMVYSRFLWEIDPEVLFIKGCVNSYFISKVPQLSEIHLELNNNMIIDSILFRDENVAHEYYSEFRFKIILNKVLETGQLDSVRIYYHGVPEQGNGFGSFTQAEHEGVPVIWTLSEPFGAKDWWPGKNDLNDKIDSVDVIVKSPKQYRTASNGLLISETEEGDYRTCHWKHRYPIVSYLVAIAVTNYVEFTQYAVVNGDSIPIINFVYPEDSAQAASDSQNTAGMIELFSDLFGAYPFAAEKYGHAQFSWGGGMEHQTMSFMAGFGHDLRAHELAHSWFGNKITLGSWHDIFLNEGFATYSTGLSFENMYNGFYWNIWKSNTRNAATDTLSGSVYVEDTSSVSRIFNARLSYHKGAYLLHMLRWILGDENFFNGLQNYLADPMLAYRFATLNDFKAHMENAGNTNLSEFFADWYYGEGYPTYGINIEQMEEDGAIHLSIFQEQSHPSVDYFEMTVPVTLYGQGSEITYYCENSFSGQEYVYEFPGFKLDSAKFDTEQWLLARLDFMNLGLDDAWKLKISLSPNPASETIQFFIPDRHIQKILIYDISGKPVLEKNMTILNEMVEMDISQLAGGLYVLVAITEDGNYHTKFVKW
ncbi:MAG: T9SS type A sorting domain-containing protein, partial [Bacteroidales bacterium]|nr:T9SS type A sorting domain-containing protein [Bacteroidales bacterium]